MKRDDLVTYLDDYLQIGAIADLSDNGLQVEGAPEITRLAFAVDASLAAFKAAQESHAQMLIVHHGLFWGRPLMVTGIHHRRLSQLLAAGISLYAAHLPLDLHPDVGNNATLARWLKLEDAAPFGDYKGQPAGVVGRLPTALPLDRFVAQVEESLGEPVVQIWPFGPENVSLVGIISGSAASMVNQVAEAGVDVFLTGEVSHTIYHQAQELGINIVYGGHYATETAGLKALAQHLAEHLGLETTFLHLPTGA
jgi:dinuclear metal center YbgI/SA1388 family protein